MVSENYIVNEVYQGGYNSLSPSYGDVFTGYRVSAGELGATTNPQSANQIAEVSKILNQGIKPIEMGSMNMQQFDSIPKQHFKEINRMAQLTGAKISLHAPIQGTDPAGFINQQGGWKESDRELIERQFIDVLDKAYELDPSGNLPITIHASNTAGSEYKMTPEGKKYEQLIAVNQESGQMIPLTEEERWSPASRSIESEEQQDKLIRDIQSGKISEKEAQRLATTKIPVGDKPRIMTPESRLRSINATEWDNAFNPVILEKRRADEIIKVNEVQVAHILPELHAGKISPEHLNPVQQNALKEITDAQVYLDDVQQHVDSLFSKAYKYGNKNEREYLKKLSDQYAKQLNKNPSMSGKSEALHNLIYGLKERVTPQTYVPIEDFSIQKGSKTFANVAFETFKKYGNKSPILSLENLYPGMGFVYGEHMEGLIKESRNKFANRLIREKGMGEAQAKREAERMIGMTLDVGHLNITKKHGFKDKDILKEVEKFAPFVKHVHLTDNFGYGDSHLTPGMGNVPTKEILEKLEKAGKLEGTRKIIEAGGLIQHFGTVPTVYSYEGLGSSMFEGGGIDSPYWNQAAGLTQGYSGGMGNLFPQINYQTFGASFSQLPQNLGGSAGGGGGSRMSGTPME